MVVNVPPNMCVATRGSLWFEPTAQDVGSAAVELRVAFMPATAKAAQPKSRSRLLGSEGQLLRDPEGAAVLSSGSQWGGEDDHHQLSHWRNAAVGCDTLCTMPRYSALVFLALWLELILLGPLRSERSVCTPTGSEVW